jgi:hypothetical protein
MIPERSLISSWTDQLTNRPYVALILTLKDCIKYGE